MDVGVERVVVVALVAFILKLFIQNCIQGPQHLPLELKVLRHTVTFTQVSCFKQSSAIQAFYFYSQYILKQTIVGEEQKCKIHAKGPKKKSVWFIYLFFLLFLKIFSKTPTVSDPKAGMRRVLDSQHLLCFFCHIIYLLWNGLQCDVSQWVTILIHQHSA